MKKLLILFLLLSCIGCTIQQQRNYAKKRIAHWYGEFPELIQRDSTFKSDTTRSFKSDTTRSFLSDTTEKKIVNTDSLMNILDQIAFKSDSVIKSVKDKDSVISFLKAYNKSLMREVDNVRIKLKNACKETLIHEKEQITITNDSSTVVNNNTHVKDQVPVETKSDPTFFELIEIVWWWLLVAFGLGYVVNIVIKILVKI